MNNKENINYPAPLENYKVLIRCFTYNQSKYIEDALDGFAMQQTNFPFVCLVMDDASTDGEQEVIKSWMEHECDMNRAEIVDIPTSVIIIVPHKTNFSCTFAFYLLKQNLFGTGDKKMNHIYPWREKCEYEAICEGDDYWIDSLKLQKQVDILDNNPSYGLVYGKAKIFIQKELKFKGKIGNQINNFNHYFLNNKQIPTATVLIRINIYSKFLQEIKDKKWKMSDYPLWLHTLLNSKVYFINDFIAVYRVLENSATCRNDYYKRKNFILSGYEISLYYAKKANIKDFSRLTNDINTHLFNNAYVFKQKDEAIFFFKKITKKTVKIYIKYLILNLFLR